MFKREQIVFIREIIEYDLIIRILIDRNKYNIIRATYFIYRRDEKVAELTITSEQYPTLKWQLTTIMNSYTIKSEENSLINDIWHKVFIHELPQIITANPKKVRNPIIDHFPEYWTHLSNIYGK